MKRRNNSHVHAALFINSMINENPYYSKKNFAVLKCCACAVRRFAAIIVRTTKSNLVAEDTRDVPLSKYKQVSDEAINLNSTNHGFKTSNRRNL